MSVPATVKYPFAARERIARRCRDLQLKSGGWPTNLPQDNESCIWTTADVLLSLTLARAPIADSAGAVQYILTHERYEDCWTDGNLFPKPRISIGNTALAAHALVLAGNVSDAEAPLTRLQQVRNPDGGWGVMPGDMVSRVRTSFYALMALLDCLRSTHAPSVVDRSLLQASLDWLCTCRTGTNGFGRNVGDPSDDVSCTAMALTALVSAVAAGFHVRAGIISDGFEKLRHCGRDGTWMPTQETFVGHIDGYGPFIVPIRSSGSPRVFIAYALAVMNGMVNIIDAPFAQLLAELDSRCYDGLYHLPLGPEDVRVWEAPYWLVGLRYFEDVVLKELEQGVLLSSAGWDNEYSGTFKQLQQVSKDKARLEAKYQRAMRTTRLSIILAAVMVIAVVALYAVRYWAALVKWFSVLPELDKVLIGAVLALVLEELYKGYLRKGITKLVRGKKQGPHDTGHGRA